MRGAKEQLEAQMAALQEEVGSFMSCNRQTCTGPACQSRRVAALHSLALDCLTPLYAAFHYMPRLALHPVCVCLQNQAALSSTRWKEEREAKREGEWDQRLKEAYK